MILPRVRASFGANELRHLVPLLARRAGRPAELWERRAMEAGLDSLLDHPEAPAAIMEGGGLSAVPPRLAFYVMVRHALLDAGLEDPTIADYVASLLLEFGEGGRAFRIDRHDDRTYHYLVDLVAEIGEEDSDRRQFLLRAHLGNYSLWLSGLFPDYVVARVRRKGAPGLDYYEDLGSAGYRLASEHNLADRYDLSGVYRDVAERFRAVRRALNAVADRYFFPVTTSSIDRYLRRVIDGLGFN